MNLRAYRSMTLASLRMYLRNPIAASAVFLGLLAFIAAFKFLGDGTPHVKVVLTDGVNSITSTQVVYAIATAPGFELKRLPASGLRAEIEAGTADLAIQLVARNTQVEARATYKESANAATALLLVRGIVADLNVAALGGTPPVALSANPVAGRPLGPIDQMLPGLLAFNIVQSSLLFAAGLLASYRSSGVLRRIQATGVDSASFVLAIATGTFIVSLVQTVGLVVAARALYTMQLDLAPLLLVTALGIVVFLALGFAISGFVRDAQRAPSIATTVAMPMIFVGLFPPHTLPDAITPIIDLLPISLITRAMRQIAENPSNSLLPQLVGLGAWALLGLVAAARAFRWD